jgi:hypothetical protein
MKSAFFSTLLVILTILSQNARAELPDGDKLLKYIDLVKIADASMTAEVNRVNEELAKGNYKIPGYNEKDLKFFADLGKVDFSSDFLANKCIMDDKSVEAILSKHMTRDNDGVTTSIGSLATVEGSYNSKLWHLFSKMCQFSEARFTERLQTLTSNGVPLQLNEAALTNLSGLVFFPTDYGKPSFRKTLDKRLGVAATVGLVAGTIASLAGANFAGVFISLAVISSGSLALKNSLPRAENKLRKLEITNISPDSVLKIDFNEDELAQMN